MRCIELQSNPQLSFALLEEFGTEMLTNCALVSLCSHIYSYTYVKGAVVHFGWCYAHFRDKMSFRDTIWAVVFYMSRTRRRNMCFKLWRWTMESVHVVCSSTGFWDKDISIISTARSQFSKYYLHTDIITFSTISIDVSVSCVV